MISNLCRLFGLKFEHPSSVLIFIDSALSISILTVGVMTLAGDSLSNQQNENKKRGILHPSGMACPFLPQEPLQTVLCLLIAPRCAPPSSLCAG